MTGKITLHHLTDSRSIRLLWLLEELGLPYDVQVYVRQPNLAAPTSLGKVAPLGKAPALTIDDRVLVESGYIVQHLINNYDSLRAHSSSSDSTQGGKPDVDMHTSDDSLYWSHWAEGTQMMYTQPTGYLSLSRNMADEGAFGKFDENETRGMERILEALKGLWHQGRQQNCQELEAYLKAHPGKYFSGTDHPGAGDFMLFYAIHDFFLPGCVPPDGLTIGPETKRWWDMVLARPACKRAMQRMEDEEQKAKASA